jgi:hypothetical protein
MAQLDPPSPTAWRRSTFCEAGACVEVSFAEEAVLVRDSKDTAGPSLEFSFPAWRTFLNRAKSGTFDCAAYDRPRI